MNTRIIFMGSPNFALPSLRALSREYSIVGVITQPDRPAGRGQSLTPPPVKVLAQELGLPFIQPRRMSQPEVIQQLHDWAPNLIVVAAFGQILRAEVLHLPQYGCVNVHASLLPRWRGAAPIQAAILQGDQHTGVTIMHMDEGIDTGPILSQRVVSIYADDTAGSLSDRLSVAGAELLIATLPQYLRGELHPRPQADTGVTYAPMLKKQDGLLDFTQNAEELSNRVRAFNPWPGAYTLWKETPLKIHRAHPIFLDNTTPGLHRIIEAYPAIEAQAGILILDEVQPAGKRAMPGDVFLHGAQDWETKGIK
jgi:methionyl-tRNA formyltransferase